MIRSLRAAYSDFRLEVADLVVDGNTVWARNVGSGTNDGPFMGHPPTGRSMSIEVFDVVRVRDGKIVEHWGVPDRLGALFQLGLAPPPASAAVPALTDVAPHRVAGGCAPGARRSSGARWPARTGWASQQAETTS